MTLLWWLATRYKCEMYKCKPNFNACVMSALTDTEKSYSEVVCINSLSRSKPVNTCATKNTIWTLFMHTAPCIVVTSCVHLKWCQWQIRQWNILLSEELTLLRQAKWVHNSLVLLCSNNVHSKSYPLNFYFYLCHPIFEQMWGLI